MVYCGRPSRACQMCKARRIKCDETKPTCIRCVKSRRKCPGYKDDFDLVFRNETKATERRAKKASKKGSAPSAEQPGPDLLSPSGSTGARGSWALVSSPQISVEEQASCLFVSNFIVTARDGRTAGHFDFIIPLLKQEGPDSHMQHAFNACALSFLNNRKALGARYWDKALSEYLVALARTNAALRDTDAQQSDSTLGAVLLLGMFESISAKQISSFNWGSHVDGAVQLVKSRGKKQIRSKVGMQLFIAVRTLMAVKCLTSSKAPAMGAEWWLDGTAFSKPAVAAQRLMIRTSEVRAQVSQLIDTLTKTPENVELMFDLIRRAQAVDHEAAAWLPALPESWHARTVAWEDSVPGGDYARADVFPGRVDVYSDLLVASVVNCVRTVRMMLHAMIVRCAAWVCAPVDYRTTPEYATAADVCREAITDVVASVPYFLGWHLRRKDRDAPRSVNTFPCGEDDTAKGLAGYFISWPLTCVVSQDYATDAQRAWAIGRLSMIGGDLGVRYALAMCQLQVRVPSMMIRRDVLMRSHPAAVVGASGVDKVAAARTAPPTAGYAMNPQQQWEAVQRTRADQGKAELVGTLTGHAADAGLQLVAQRWLKI
ncbi:hypothetical protein F4802DRAFT_593646 [Xylaria palmicola]|nr:hypothetical protein F4802DRAFT_593646 [Xylaria palmicola]